MPDALTSTGLTVKSLAERRESLVARVRAAVGLGPGVPTEAGTAMGDVIDVINVELQSLADTLADLYTAFQASGAEGAALDNLAALVGVTRLAASKSLGDATLTGDSTTVVPAGKAVRVPLGPRFLTRTTVTIPDGVVVNVTAVDDTADYTVNLEGNDFTYSAQGGDGVPQILAGLQALVDANAAYNAEVTGTDLWCRRDDRANLSSTAVSATGTGSLSKTDDKGYETVGLESEDTGPIEAGAGSITEIVDAVAGWETVSNPADVDPGRDQETDTGLRLRRTRSLQSGTVATDQAIRTAVEAVDKVEAVMVQSNRTLTTDSNGIPAKSFRVTVHPELADTEYIQAIAQAIWETMPAGILAYGTDEAVTVTDDQGYSQSVFFDWVVEIPIHVEVTLTKDAALYPTDGDAQVRANILAYVASLGVGDDVYPIRVDCGALEVDGVLDVTAKVDTVDPPVNTSPLAMALNQLATLDSGDIDIA